MSFENPKNTKLDKVEENNLGFLVENSFVDQKLYDRFMEVKLSFLKETRPDIESTEEQKKRFINGEVESVHFSYEKNSEIDYEQKEKIMLSFREELKKDLAETKKIKDKKREILIQSYLWAVNEKIAKIRMLREGQLMNSNNTESDIHSKKFQRYTEFIYGKPEMDIFIGVIDRLSKDIDSVSEESLSETQKDSLGKIRKIVFDFKQRGLSNTHQFNYYKETTESELISDPEEIKRYFLEALIETGLLYEGWTIQIDETGKIFAFSVNVTSKKIIIPSESKLKNRQKGRETSVNAIKGLIEHEIKTHALRSSRGEKSRIKLLQTGLDRYLVGEEGLATFREHQETGANDFAGFSNYLAIGLAYGLDNGIKRDFVEIFNILFDYYHSIEGKNIDDAKELAWRRAYRVFKGTTGDVPGLVLTRDLIYRRGNIATYELMNKDGSEKIDLNVGKYDQTNPRHINLLIEFGVLDEDLKKLELWH